MARCAWRSPSAPWFATSTPPAETLEALKEVGVQIAIDDFGTGYAVLSHLKSLPVDTLKIDTSFVRDLGTSSRDLAIVRAIIGLAEAFDLQLVAEGVETPAAALTLMRHGCHRAQGYLLLASAAGPRHGIAAVLALDADAVPGGQPGPDPEYDLTTNDVYSFRIQR